MTRTQRGALTSACSRSLGTVPFPRPKGSKWDSARSLAVGMEATSKLQYGEIVPLMSHVNQIPRPTTLHLYPGHVHRSVQTYGSAATRRHCRPVHFRSLPVRTSKRRTHQLPATALDTGELQGRESLALYSQGNIFSARRERVFKVRYARTKQTKKKNIKRPTRLTSQLAC